MALNFVSSWEDIFLKVSDLFTDGAPIFLGRIGGSDTDAIIDYYSNIHHPDLKEMVYKHADVLKHYNGYYDKTNDYDNIEKFIRQMIYDYSFMKHFTIVGSKLQTVFFKENISPDFWVAVSDNEANAYRRFLDMIASKGCDCFCYPFSFIERCVNHEYTLFRLFAKILCSKKVIAVTPFSQSISINFQRRKNFFRNYDYPEFDLCTLNTPITYGGLPISYYPHDNWFDTVDQLQKDLSTMSFDIALLCCGSYAMPLGNFIANTMRKKAIYVGGVLQLYFGIMGRRYDNPFFRDQINKEYFIRPQEFLRYVEHTNITANTPKEAFGAYF